LLFLTHKHTYNNGDRFKSLKDEYNDLRMNYYGLPCSDLNFDVDLISHVILDLRREKSADIYSLTADYIDT